ncbi:MAG: hypothetical protein COB33_012280 [Thiotrichaceae bacterium]|nr:hypothetical protein [Thiotrichaceae bacterium]MBL1260625.1 hypothetical protein [Thiotrichaceae bacterium]MBL1261297.1 hypothetical protein [Thiotrichaceae bacterium]PCI11084.1 MAG: hypothetical protein COB71_11600 [Thiotrichales bacterium]
MLATHQDAEARYTKIRKAVLEISQRKLATKSEYSLLKLKLITAESLRESKKWMESTSRRVDWDWTDGYTSFKFRYPKRFELAIWSGNELVSLTMGRPTYSGTALRLDFTEASPDKAKELKVIPAVLFVMITYAEILGAEQIRVMNPINDDVKNYYKSVGLTYVSKDDYLYMRL